MFQLSTPPSLLAPPSEGPSMSQFLVPLLKWLVAKCCMITAGERRHHHIQGIARKKKKKPQLIHRDVILVIDSCPFYRGCLFSCAGGIRIPT